MTTGATKVDISRRFCAKLRKFNYYYKLGEELFTGGHEGYDEPYYLDGGDYEDDVVEFVESLSDIEKEGLESFNPEFYKRLMTFYKEICDGTCDSFIESDYDDDNLNIVYE